MTRKTHVTTGRLAREARQEGAKERAADRAKRSTKQQLALIAKRPGKSAREVARLKRAS